jgi:hypothetical protein
MGEGDGTPGEEAITYPFSMDSRLPLFAVHRVENRWITRSPNSDPLEPSVCVAMVIEEPTLDLWPMIELARIVKAAGRK